MNMINIAYTGAQAAQSQLNTTAMNTANAFTPGYSRQRVESSAIGPNNGLMSAGNGVEVVAIRRVADQYLINQLWKANSSSNYFATTQQYLNGLETTLGNDSTNIGAGFDKFFASLNEATTQPDSRALRQQILNEANALAMRFNNIDNAITSQRTAIYQQRGATVTSMNTLTANIASLNRQVTELEATGANSNVLRDERDELVKQLTTLADVTVREEQDSSYTVSFKNGEPLVAGRIASTLILKDMADGSQELELTFARTTFGVGMSVGGQLGALYDYDVQTLQSMQDVIYSMAQQLADTFNAQLAQGFDLNDNPGQPLFNFAINQAGGILQINDLSSDQLALSDMAGEPGNGSNLQALISVKNSSLVFPHLGQMTLNDVSAAIISDIGIASRQNQVEEKASSIMLYQAQVQRDSLSGVNTDEEAVNLLTYSQAYQSNLKVMSTGDQLFAELLALF